MTCNSQGLLYVLERIVIHNFAMWGKGITFPDLVSSSPHLPKACGNQNCQANVNVLKLSQSSLLIFQMPREGEKKNLPKTTQSHRASFPAFASISVRTFVLPFPSQPNCLKQSLPETCLYTFKLLSNHSSFPTYPHPPTLSL